MIGATRTETIALTPSSGVTIRLQNDFRSRLNQSCEKLADITLKYFEEKDELSIKIHNWCCKTLNVNFNAETDEAAAAILGRKILKLARNILCNPITKTLYKDPVWVGEWVLEREMLSHLDSFDGQLIGNPKAFLSHFFCLEMADWVRSLVATMIVPDPAIFGDGPMEMVLFKQNDPIQSAGVLVERLDPESNAAILQVFYRQMCNSAVRERDARRMRELAEREMERLQVSRRANQEALDLEVASAQRAFAEHERRIVQRISSIEKEHEKNVNTLQEQMEDQNRRHQEIHHTQTQTLNLLEVRLNEAIDRSAGIEKELLNERQNTQSQSAEIQRLRETVAQQANHIQGVSRNSGRRGRCTIQ